MFAPENLRISLDPDLPIVARADDIARAIENHQVVVVAGETGSGKTTQLPKICLRAGLTRIAHTQPRRIAARSVAERIADEMQVEIGDVVGYQVRFTKQASRATQVKVMTDGVLLAEIGRDRDLRQYDCIIIDEAHERSLNIDFLLGYLKQLLQRRDDLTVIVTSATIDTERFAEHFSTDEQPCPIIEVSGRTYPVEVRYRPIAPEPASDDPDESGDLDDPDTAKGPEPPTEVTPEVPEARDQIDAICDAVQELQNVGDILVFLSGEREIRDTADALAELELRDTEILPLFARLSAAEQQRVFSRSARRRVVLATNVAETSITVPGIRAVIDPGTARISRYSTRTKVQRLPIEPISRASADQRAGRCGRVAPGVCIRLYSEQDYEARPEFTEPEILRTNLASVILQMAEARLGDIASFPFVEAPDRAQVTDGLRLLTELGALRDRDSGEPRLTRVGHLLARLPLDPRLARMLVEAERRDCLSEVLVIVAGLTIQDPRERPTDQAEQATAMHRRFWSADIERPEDEASDATESSPPDRSDFMAILRMWNYLRRRRRELSGNRFRRMCREEFLHFVRIREWQDLHRQLRDITEELGMKQNQSPAGPDAIHTAIVSGLLSNIGLAPVEAKKQRDRRGRPRRGPKEFVGPRGVRFAINPGSSVARQPPDLVMAGQLVETSRLWARTVAGIEASQVEAVAGHMLKRTYSEPRWNPRSQSVVANESVLLLGVPLVSGRRANYGRVDRAASRAIFIRSALVEGEWNASYRFLDHNAEVIAEIHDAAERTRRRDLYDEDALFAFYDARLPEHITSGGYFASWWKKLDDPHLLDVTGADLVRDPEALGATGFPDTWTVQRADGDGEVQLPVRYVFEPGTGHDGVTIEVPLPQLNQLDPAVFTWQVPGLRHELVTALLRSLPKSLRTRFVPAADHAAAVMQELRGTEPSATPFPEVVAETLRRLTGESVPKDAWGEVEGHLRPTFVIVDPARNRKEIARSADLAQLQRELGPTLTARLTRAAAGAEAKPSTTWNFGTLHDTIGRGKSHARITGYPGLHDAGNAVSVLVHDRREVRDREHARGLRRLVLVNTPDPTRWTVAHLSNRDKLALGTSPYADVPALLADARLKATGDLIAADPEWESVRDRASFTALCDRVRQDQADRMREVVALTAQILRTEQQIRRLLPEAPAEMGADITEQIDNLLFPGFIGATEEPHFSSLPRYLDAALHRIENRDGRDEHRAQEVWDVEDLYAELCAEQPEGPLPPDVEEIGWLIEEFRVSVFAQRLGTRVPISRKRIRKAIDAARGR